MDRPVQIDSGLFLVGRAHTDRCRNWNGLFRPSDAHHNRCEFWPILRMSLTLPQKLEDGDSSKDLQRWGLFGKKGLALGQGYIRAWIILLATNNEILSVVSLRSFWGRHYEQWVCTSGSDSSSQSSLGCFQPFVVCGKGVRLSRWQKSTPTPESSLDVLFTFQRKGEVGFHCGVHTHISQVSLWHSCFFGRPHHI